MPAAFFNYINVGAGNDGFNDGADRTIASGQYRLDEFAEAFLAAWTLANRRFAISSDGFVTLHNNGGANFSISFTGNGDTNLRDMLGFTGNLSGANTYTASRKLRPSWHLINSTLRDFDLQPTAFVEQTRSRGGLTRTTQQGRLIDECIFEIQFAANDVRLVSPSAAVGTTYANANAFDPGITEYLHARDFWFDATSAASQGMSDGRPVVFFEDQTDSDFTMTSASSPAWDNLVSAEFSTWVFDVEALRRFPREKARSPKTHMYNIRIPACEYLAP